MISLNHTERKDLTQRTMDCPNWSHQFMKNNPYVQIGWYDQPSVLPGWTKDCPAWSIRRWKNDPNILIGWYDKPYPHWMEGFYSTDHGLSRLVPSVHEKWPIRTNRLIQSAIRTAWKDQGLSRLVSRSWKIDPYVLIRWYDQPYPYWMEGFNSTDEDYPD